MRPEQSRPGVQERPGRGEGRGKVTASRPKSERRDGGAEGGRPQLESLSPQLWALGT